MTYVVVDGVVVSGLAGDVAEVLDVFAIARLLVLAVGRRVQQGAAGAQLLNLPPH